MKLQTHGLCWLGSLLAVAALHAQAPALKLDLGNSVQMDMILVQPGSFEQGSSAAEAGHEADETQRRVTLTRQNYLAKFPVTRGQFARFIEATRHRTEAEAGPSGGFGVVDGKLVQQKQFTWRNPGFEQTDDHPVVIVSALDAAAFCNWLTVKTGRLCELPTEAQWEFAARAGTNTAHYAEPVDDIAWHRGNALDQTHPVGAKKANAWGFHDFYGPVWQWCRDWYAPYPAGAATDPLQSNPNLADKPRQVLRGGSFISDVSHARSAERYRNDARSRNADNGFRIVCSTTQRATATIPPPVKPSPPTPPPFHSSSHVEFHPSKSASGGSWFGSLFRFAIPLVILGIIVRKVLSFFSGAAKPSAISSGMTGPEAAARLSAKPSPLGHRFAFNLTDDGFYITGPAEAVGSQLRYECVVAGRMIADEIAFTPGPQGQFIFTGKKPSSVRVQATGGAADTDSSVISHGSSFDDDHHRSSIGSSSSSSRYPSAY
ncbi:MAG: formylglycine-generating enzyme family protein [Prosthecobacter sp.]|uniref:formylglycine-generating enzyme family protein n=1 Tax=Prosthecobacter sp. TaxID=1965333 RepID=UPI00390054AF